MRRSDWYQKKFKDVSILSIASDLHAINTGALELFDPDHQFKNSCIKAIREVLENWEESLKSSKEFDNAVKNLLEVTLLETKSIDKQKEKVK